MSLLLDVKFAAQILNLVILIIALILALRKFTTNNNGTQMLAGGNGVTSSNQDNIQITALNVNTFWPYNILLLWLCRLHIVWSFYGRKSRLFIKLKQVNDAHAVMHALLFVGLNYVAWIVSSQYGVTCEVCNLLIMYYFYPFLFPFCIIYSMLCVLCWIK